MARGSLAGIVSGVVVSGLALGVASLSLPPVEMGAVPGSEMGDAMPAETEDSPVVIDPAPAPEVEPAPEAEAEGDAEDATEAEEPESAEPESAEPEMAPEASPDAEPETDDAAEPVPAPEPAAAPAPEADASEPAPAADPVETPDAQPAAEPLTGDETGADPASAPAEDADDTPQRGEAAETEITAQPTGTPLPETDRAPQMEVEADKAPMAVAEDDPAAIPGSELVEKLPTALPPTGAADAAPESGPVPQAAATAPGATDDPDTSGDKATGNALSVEPEAEEAPEIATIVAEPAPEPRTVIRPAAPAPAEPEPEPTPEAGLSGAGNVVTGRLPTIGDDAPETEPAPETAAEAADPAALADLPAIARNGTEFNDTSGLPLLALLLLDDGDRVSLEDIGKLPFPLTVAVDASAADAADAISFYATRGIEVALVLPLPAGASATDVDTTVQAYRPLLDGAAEVVVEQELGFQTLGPGAAQLATNLAESGHGLVSFPAGLNTGHKEAEKQGVPAGLVFLDLDGEGQNGPVIRRFLDNAAFRARNEEGVIVLARTRSETLQALLEWSLGNRAQSVALAPISAVLLAE